MEHLHLAHLSTRHKIVNCFRYIDDILLIFDTYHTNIQTILDDFNTIRPKLKFTAEVEANNMLNYLDISIQRTLTHWKTCIYRKPTFTDTIIPYTSNHPTQHKYAAIKFLYDRLKSYVLQEEEDQEEENIIRNIMYNNSFPVPPPNPPPRKPRQQLPTTQTPTHR